MEQGVVSIITSTGMVDNSVGKPKNISISLANSPSMQTAKEKLTASLLTSLMKEDATGKQMLIFGIAEMLGSAILVFVGCSGCIGSLGEIPNTIQVSFTFGFAVMTAIQAFGHVSGSHINPAITLATVIVGKTSLPMALVYICAQCLGSLIGYGLLKMIISEDLMYSSPLEATASFCMPVIDERLSPLQGFAMEAIAVGILVLFACGIWDYRNARNTDSVSIRFGLCIAMLSFAIKPYTGCGLNPARTLGPAIWNGYWANHWVYWVGPFTGSTVASLFYRCVMSSNKMYTNNENLTGVQT